MTLVQLHNPYLTREDLAASPSRSEGISQETERRLKAYGAELVQDAGILLKLSQVAMATGQALLHRFYTRKSLHNYNIRLCAKSCLFIACKLEEDLKHPRDILNVFYLIDQVRTQAIEPSNSRLIKLASKEYIEGKDEMLSAERRIMKELGFNLYVEHPHKYLLNYLRILTQDTNRPMAQTAWNYMNDSLRTSVSLLFPPEVIATACIYMAAFTLGIVLPEEPSPWWELFDSKKEDLDEIAYMIQELYNLGKLEYISVSHIGKKRESVERPPNAATRIDSPSRRPRDRGGRERDRNRDRDRDRPRDRDRDRDRDRRRPRHRGPGSSGARRNPGTHSRREEPYRR